MIRTREGLEDLDRVARMLVTRPASNEELRDAILFVIETINRLVDELDENRRALASGETLKATETGRENALHKHSS